VRNELEDVQKAYGGKADPRRTEIVGQQEEITYTADDFIIEEDNVVIVSHDGWVKRQKDVKDLSTTRLREGDRVLACEAGSTRSTIAFFTNFGSAYTCRIVDVPASTGYGEPIQSLFKFRDGERVVAAMSLDPRAVGDIASPAEGQPAPVHALALASDGYALRFGLDGLVEPSTRAGRRYARPADKAEVVGVAKIGGAETIIGVTREARAMLCPVEEVNFLAGPGKGVIFIKIDPAKDRVLGFVASVGDRDLLVVETSRGAEQTVSTAKYEVTSRGGRGRELLQRGQFTRVIPREVAVPSLGERNGTDGDRT
jgi:DNA gyrase subunit A